MSTTIQALGLEHEARRTPFVRLRAQIMALRMPSKIAMGPGGAVDVEYPPMSDTTREVLATCDRGIADADAWFEQELAKAKP